MCAAKGSEFRVPKKGDVRVCQRPFDAVLVVAEPVIILALEVFFLRRVGCMILVCMFMVCMFRICDVPWSEKVGEKVSCRGLREVRFVEGLEIGLWIECNVRFN